MAFSSDGARILVVAGDYEYWSRGCANSFCENYELGDLVTYQGGGADPSKRAGVRGRAPAGCGRRLLGENEKKM